jgi:hypothetical protein
MAHYAFIDKSNIVVQVIVGKDENEEGIDWEQRYAEINGLTCKRTSYNTRAGVHLLGGVPFRKNYAGVGYSYNETMDAFIPPQPFPSWTLNESTAQWDPPMPMPTDSLYAWDEEQQQWIKTVTL